MEGGIRKSEGPPEGSPPITERLIRTSRFTEEQAIGLCRMPQADRNPCLSSGQFVHLDLFLLEGLSILLWNLRWLLTTRDVNISPRWDVVWDLIGDISYMRQIQFLVIGVITWRARLLLIVERTIRCTLESVELERTCAGSDPHVEVCPTTPRCYWPATAVLNLEVLLVPISWTRRAHNAIGNIREISWSNMMGMRTPRLYEGL